MSESSGTPGENARVLFGDRFASIEPGRDARSRTVLRSGPLVLQRLPRLLRALPEQSGPKAHL